MRADINDLKRMISELMKGGVPCPEPVRDVKALLPTTAQSSYVPAVASYPQPPVYAESEKVTDEPPREMTKADMQRRRIITPCAAATAAAANNCRTFSCRAHYTAR